jgi:hypothetical protein
MGTKGPNWCMVEKVRPLLKKYGANAYFDGDEHVMQHFSEPVGPGKSLEYFVSGCTAFIDDNSTHSDCVNPKYLRYFWKTNEDQYIGCQNCSGAIVYIEASDNKMDFTYVSTNNVELYKTTMSPRNSNLINVGSSMFKNNFNLVIYCYIMLLFLIIH